MSSESKILTVSYGTFSCTLEGFDDPINTMKAIAEYFRDLTTEDRYFGSVPPQPDAAMLHRIAEREVSRLVDAKAGDGEGAVRPGARLTGRARGPRDGQDIPKPAPVLVEPAVQDVIPSGVAAKLARIRQSVTPPPIAAAFAEEALAERPMTAPVAEGPVAEGSARDAVEALLRMPEGEVPTSPAPDVMAPDVMVPDVMVPDVIVPDVMEPVAPLAEVALSDSFGAAEIPADDVAGPEVLDEWAEAVEPAVTFAADEVADEAELATEAADALAVEAPGRWDADALPEDQPDDLAAGQPFSPALAEAIAPLPEDLAADLAEDLAADLAADLPAEIAADLPEDHPASPEAVLDESAEEPPAPVAEPDPVVEDRPAPVGKASGKTKRVNSRVVRIHADEDASAPPTDPNATRILDPSGDDAEVARLLRQADDVMADEDNRRRMDSIAHLRAAVAATEADRAATGETAKAPTGPNLDPYRQDLADVVQPDPVPAAPPPPEAKPRRKTVSVRPQEPRPGTIRPGMISPPPLVLVSEQRIDRLAPSPAPTLSPAALVPSPAAPSIAPGIGVPPGQSEQPLRTGRLTGAIGVGAAKPVAALAPQRLTMDKAPQSVSAEPEEEDDLDEALSEADAAGLAEFAEQVGVKSIADMLEAAAAYATCIERRDQFTRPQLMRRLMAMADGRSVTREEGLRSFGTLLRTGRIEKVTRGFYVLAAHSPYLAEARRIG
jgi:hypothetical protein